MSERHRHTGSITWFCLRQAVLCKASKAIVRVPFPQGTQVPQWIHLLKGICWKNLTFVPLLKLHIFLGKTFPIPIIWFLDCWSQVHVPGLSLNIISTLRLELTWPREDGSLHRWGSRWEADVSIMDHKTFSHSQFTGWFSLSGYK